MILVENLSKAIFDNNVKHEYFYRMFKSEILVDGHDGKIEVQSYGIEIERQDIAEGEVIGIQRDFIKNVSPHRHKVHNLMRMLFDNTVSPIHLVDVIAETLDYYIMDFDKVVTEAAY
ncbi:MAG: DUF6514 family protein [Solirubrobacterales bacterium]